MTLYGLIAFGLGALAGAYVVKVVADHAIAELVEIIEGYKNICTSYRDVLQRRSPQITQCFTENGHHVAVTAKVPFLSSLN